MRLSTGAALIFVFAASIHAAFAIVRAPAWTVDDAFIVARYAEHLVHYKTIAWNVGEPPVEGFTSLLSLLIAAVAEFFSFPPIRALVLVDEAAYLTSGVLLLLLAQSMRLPLLAGAVVAVVHLTVAEHLTHATSGLETELFVALSLALAIATARALEGRSIAVAAVFAFLLSITRPEGTAAGIVAVAVILVVRRRVFGIIAGFFVPLSSVVVWRWLTFHALAPNTFYAKEGSWNRGHLNDLWTLTSQHYLDVLVIAAAIVAIVAIGCSRRPHLSSTAKWLTVVAMTVLLTHGVAYARSEPIMAYSRRFAVHDLGWLDVIAVVTLGAAFQSIHRAVPRLRMPLGALVVLATLSSARRGLADEAGETSWTASYARMMKESVFTTAEWLRVNTAPDATIAVHPDAGLVPYHSRKRTIDFGLLNDARLAQSPHTPALAVAYFFELMPDYFVLADSSRRVYDASAVAILSDARFAAHYVLIRREGYLIYARQR